VKCNSEQLGVVGYPLSRNLGDEIQSIAAARLLPRVDQFIAREEMDKVDSEVDLLCNGFFIEDPLRWPPSDKVNPLFVSFHVTSHRKADHYLVNEQLASYYKQFEPIGCRDKRTARLFQSIGVDAYFSSCITTTLKNPYSKEDRSDEILLVDPLLKIADKDYREYIAHRMVPEKYRDNVFHLSHHLDQNINYSEKEKIELAEALLDRYAKAKLVITSRIHVALPCLGLGTPVLFVDVGYDMKNGYERFDGIYQFFNVISADNFPVPSQGAIHRLLRKLKVHRLLPMKKLPIDFDNPKPNKEIHQQYADELRLRVNDWLEGL